MLARVENRQMAETLRKTGVPVVNLRGPLPRHESKIANVIQGEAEMKGADALLAE